MTKYPYHGYMRKLAGLFTVLILSVSTLFAAPSLERYVQSQTGGSNQDSAAQAASLSELMYSLGNLYTYLDQNFLYEIDNQKMKDAVISAMVDSLGDKYSYFVTPENADAYAEDNRGKYIGIGTYISKYNPKYIDWDDPVTYMVTIVSPFPGGPADRAGLRAGDLVSHVDGEELYDLDASAASKKIRGTADTPITLTIHRGTAVFDITLMPEQITTPSTSKGIIDGDIGYISILEFSMTTFDSFKEDLNKLLANGAKSLIIDVRNNGGGVVDGSLNIANLFLPEGKVLLTTRFKNTSQRNDSVYYSNSTMVVNEDMPIVVLINGGTASASEILTAALQQNGRAKTVGAQSFGKGITQFTINFMGGYLNITVAENLTPDGSCIHGIGITPDYEVQDAEDYSDEELEAYAHFREEPYIEEWLEACPEYSKENILAFADAHADSGVPQKLLQLLIRNEYIYAMEYNDRPVADTDFDTQLVKAIEVIREMEANSISPESSTEVVAE